MNKRWEGSEPENITEMNTLGCKLSIAIDCSAHRVAPGVDILECEHGVVFPLYLLRRENWAATKRRHDEEKDYIL